MRLSNSRISRLLPYLARHRVAMGSGVLAIVAGDLLLLLSPWYLRQAIDRLNGGDTAGAREAALLMLAVVAAGGLFKFVMRRWMIGASRLIEQELRHDFLAQLFRLSPAFYDRRKVGDLMALATNDLNAVRMLLGPGIMYLVNTTVTISLALVFMVNMSPQLSLVALLPLPLLALAVQQGSKLTYRRFAVVQEQFGRVNSLAQETLSGIRVLKAYAREEDIARRFDAQSDEFVELNVRYFQVQALMHPAMSMLAGLAAALTLWYGGRLVITGEATVGMVVAFLAYLAQLTWPAIALGWTVNLWQRGLASLDRIDAVFGEEPEVAERPDAVAWEPREGGLRIRGLRFAYPGSDEPALEDIDLELPPGRWTAVVGPTGSGKTTLVRLLTRQYDHYEGRIELDGHELRELRIGALREGTGYAPQDGYLFSDTLRANIAFGGPVGAPPLADDRLEQLAETSRLANDYDAFPQGWDTPVGERGVTLSGGQKQRVGIARALAHDPQLLLLDDVFSSVDTETERELIDQLRGAWEGRTVLLVTHRLLAVQEADQIVVLDEGRIVDRGTHDELLARGGLYAELFRRQSAEAELDQLGDGA